MKLTRWFLPIMVAIVGILTLVSPVLALIPQPTSLEIQEVVAYENVRLDGDQLYIIPYYIDFETLPDDGADELFIFRLLDEDDEEITWITPFAFHDSGYGLGVVAFYLEPDEVPTWAENLTVVLIGSPFADWGGDLPSVSLDIISWNTGTTGEIQNLVTAKVLQLATDLGQAWDVEMTVTTQGITTLSSTGASYFAGVIPYLPQIAPAGVGRYIFSPDWPEDSPSDTTYATWLEEQVDGTIFDIKPMARSLGIARGALIASVYYGIVGVFFVILISKKGLKKGMMLLLWPFVIGGAFIGIPLVVTILGGFFCLLSTVWLFYKAVA